jgi:hypothetical protein
MNLPDGILKNQRVLLLVLPVIFLIVYLLSADLLFVHVLHVQGESMIEPRCSLEENEVFRYHIEQVTVNRIQWKKIAKFSGWAFIETQNADNNEIFLVLRNNNSQYCFTSDPVARPDVTQFFHSTLNLSLTNSGFETNIPRELLENQEYQIGILIKSPYKSAFNMTDLYVNSTSLFFRKDNVTVPFYTF